MPPTSARTRLTSLLAIAAIAAATMTGIDVGASAASAPTHRAQRAANAAPKPCPTQRAHAWGILAGYKWYDAQRFKPAYAFGSGRSYTRFRYRHLHVTRAHGSNQVATATMKVTNVGKRRGVAVPQLYISKPATAALPQAPRQLVGYRSVRIPAGRSARVTFPLNNRSFASWGTAGWTVLPGCYTVAAGGSSRSLPERAKVGRGIGSCGAADLTLDRSGSLFNPLPPAARSVLLP